MAERYEPSSYNPDDPKYKENQSLESKEGKDFSTPSDDNNKYTPSTSASDKLKADIKDLRGNYGQNKESTVDTQSKYNDFKTEQLGGNYSQNREPTVEANKSSVSEPSSGGGDVNYT
jgi:hypothetical protein